MDVRLCVRIFSACFVIGLYLCEGYNGSLMGPFFPLHTIEVHNTTQMFVGTVLGAFDFGQLMGSLFFIRYMKERDENISLFIGGTLPGLLMIFFAFADYVVYRPIYVVSSVLFRLISGFFIAFFWSTGICVAINLTPKYRGGIVSALATGQYLGAALAPSIGSILYLNFNFATAFVSAGIIEIVLSLLIFSMHPLIKGKNTKHLVLHRKSLPFFQTLRQCIPVAIMGAFVFFDLLYWGYMDATLSLHLSDQFNVTTKEISVTFSLGSFSALSIIFIPMLANSFGFSNLVYKSSCLLKLVSAFLFFLPQVLPILSNVKFITFAYVTICLARPFAAGSTSLSMQTTLSEYKGIEIQQNIVIYVTTLINVGFTSGRLTGYFLFGGILDKIINQMYLQAFFPIGYLFLIILLKVKWQKNHSYVPQNEDEVNLLET